MHHAETLVIKQQDFHVQIIMADRTQFLQGHLQAAIAADRDDRLVRAADFCADRSRQAIAHRAHAAGGQEGPRQLDRIVVGRPDLVLADFSGYNRLLAANAGQIFQNVGRKY